MTYKNKNQEEILYNKKEKDIKNNSLENNDLQDLQKSENEILESLFEDEITDKVKEVLKEKKFKEENNIPKLLFKGGYCILKGISRAIRKKDLIDIEEDKADKSKEKIE